MWSLMGSKLKHVSKRDAWWYMISEKRIFNGINSETVKIKWASEFHSQRRLILHPHGRPMGRLLWVFWRKLSIVWRCNYQSFLLSYVTINLEGEWGMSCQPPLMSLLSWCPILCQFILTPLKIGHLYCLILKWVTQVWLHNSVPAQ